MGPSWAAIGLSLFLAVVPVQAAERWDGLATTVFQNYGRNHGIPHPVPTALVQDRDGFLWVGTQGGLTRWDGYRFTAYRANPGVEGSLHDDWIETLHLDAAGRLWVGGGAGGLARYDKQTDRFIPIPLRAGGERTHIGAIADDGTGGLWVGSDKGLYHLDAAGTIVRLNNDGRLATGVRTLLRTSDGTLWIGTTGGLIRSRDGSLIDMGLPEAAAGVSALLQDPEGRIWIGTRRRGLFVLDVDADQPRAVDTGPAPLTWTISSLAMAGPHEVWAGSRGAGIWAVDTNSLRVKPIRHDRTLPASLSHDDVWALLTDNAGSVWVGTTGGLSYHAHDPGLVSTVFGATQAADGLSSADVLAMLPTRDDRLWISYFSGGADLVDPAAGRILALPPDGTRPDNALPPDGIQSLAEDKAGTVYFGTGRGLYSRDPVTGTLSLYKVPGRNLRASTQSLSYDDNGVLWLGGEEDGVWGFIPGRSPADAAMPVLTQGIRLSDTGVNVIRRGHGGDLWVGTRDGLNRIDLATRSVEHIATDLADPQSLPGRFVVGLLFDRRGRLWINTFGSGVAVMTGRDAGGKPRFQRVGVEQGLPHVNVGSLQMDGDGTIWVGTDDGLAMIDPDSLAVRPVRRADGAALVDYVSGASATTKEGEALFGALGGFTVARPGTLPPWRFRPPIVITDLRVGGVPVPIGRYNGNANPEPLILTADTNSLAVEFAALDYSSPERNRYAYRLDGFDRDWVETDVNRRLAIYTNLSPGDYTLHLRGTNRDGVAAERDLLLPVRVLPAPYQQRWVQGLWLVLMLALVFGLVRWRTALLRRQQSVLKQQIADHTADLRAANEMLERLAMTDPLTGCANRRHFMQRAAEMVAAAHGQGTPLSLAVLDLDDFKRINDTHGHPVGDAVLVMTGHILTGHMRATDMVGRVGGEEFALLMPHTPADGTLLLAIRLREAMEAARTPADHGGIGVTASIGVAELRADDDLDGLYARADAALYAAKEAGRNRVSVAPATPV